MIRSFFVANFKSFGGTPQRVPLRPITLVFGPNSAGKSTIIQSLALAHEANRSGELDVHYTELGGDSIDLGGFQQYVHRGEPRRPVEWGATVAVDELPDAARTSLAGIEQVEVRVSFQALLTDREKYGGELRLMSVSCHAGDDLLVRCSRRPDGGLAIDHFASRFNPDDGDALETARVEDWKRVAAARGVKQTKDVEESLRELVALLGVRGQPLVEGALRVRSRGMLPTRVGRKTQTGWVPLEQPMNLLSAGERSAALAASILVDVCDVVRESLGRAVYLGPLRSYPPRRLMHVGERDPNWRAGGGAAWDVLRRDARVRERVNAWLASEHRMQTPYRLGLLTHAPLERLGAPLREVLERLEWDDMDVVADEFEGALDDARSVGADGATLFRVNPNDEDTIQRPTFSDMDASVARVIKMLREAGNATSTNDAELVLEDTRLNTTVSHRDVGVGVSQVLPVLVNAYACRNSLVAMEQPELHLHPALQAELMDVFIESALGESRNTFLLETHSEHLILRLLRRVRETTAGRLPEGVVPVSPEDVSVLYVEPSEEGSRVIPIGVTADGDFDRPWPNGFFAERREELF